MRNKIVKIISITPNDKYNLVGHIGTLHLASVGIGKSLVMTFNDERMLRTSKISEVMKTKTTIEVSTLNSKYTLEYIGGTINDK